LRAGRKVVFNFNYLRGPEVPGDGSVRLARIGATLPEAWGCVNQPLPDDQQDEGIMPCEGGAVHPPQAVTSSPTEVRDLLQRGSVPSSST